MAQHISTVVASPVEDADTLSGKRLSSSLLMASRLRPHKIIGSYPLTCGEGRMEWLGIDLNIKASKVFPLPGSRTNSIHQDLKS